MMIMKRIHLILILVFSAAVLGGCSEDEEDIELTNVALYELRLTNGTAADVEVFFLSNRPNEEFENKGILEPGQELVISNLVVRETYVVAAADPGGTQQEFFYEQTLNRSSPTNVSLTITR